MKKVYIPGKRTRTTFIQVTSKINWFPGAPQPTNADVYSAVASLLRKQEATAGNTSAFAG